MEIVIEIRNVFGIQRAYPRCRNALLFCEIANTETLTGRALARIQKLGYTIKPHTSPMNLANVA